MTTTISPLARIDSDISMASIAIGVARAAFARCPSSENARVLDRAIGAVDRLLDERLAASRP